jgi:hypothetical protein
MKMGRNGSHRAFLRLHLLLWFETNQATPGVEGYLFEGAAPNCLLDLSEQPQV